jgi:hypothetical protein
MGFLTAVGAIVVGTVSTVVLLTAALLGWTWVNEKLKSRVFEPTLQLTLLLTVALVGWFFHVVAGDAGVIGVVLGVVASGYLVYLSQQSKRPKNKWEEFRSMSGKKWQEFLSLFDKK